MTSIPHTILEWPIFWVLFSIYFLIIIITPPIVIARDITLRKIFFLYKNKLKNENFKKKYNFYLDSKFSWWYIFYSIVYYVVMIGGTLWMFFSNSLYSIIDFFMIIAFVCLGFGSLFCMILYQRKAGKRLHSEINESRSRAIKLT